MQICVDASFVLKLVLDEEDSAKARALWASWIAQGIDAVAPCHLMFECISVIRNHVYRKDISVEAGQKAYEALLAQDIQLVHSKALSEKAWTLAQRFSRPTAYDTLYLAIGDMMNCDVWTADNRLYGAVRGELEWVHALT